jgi:hypothetical protein
MTTVNPDLKVKGVYHMRGGIERYVKTFPQGGFWKGKNYLFDRRMKQVPGTKDEVKVEEEIDSKCCMCRQKWTAYRGKFKCSQSLCRVPVIVCTACDGRALKHPERLTCELCKEGYKAPGAGPDLVELKRKAESIVDNGGSTKKRKTDVEQGSLKKKPNEKATHPDRLFLARLPLTITKSKLNDALRCGSKLKIVHWITDKKSGAFYGSCVVEMTSPEPAKQIMDRTSAGFGIKIDKKKIKISFASVKEGEQWPPEDHYGKEFPPVGN